MDLLNNIPLIVIALTTISSIIGFSNRDYHDRYVFNVGAILGKSRQWDRLLTSSALHGDWMHLLFNMMTLFIFSDILIEEFGVWRYLAIYFLSVLGGGLLSLWIHRREYYYTALGASGGVVGVLFASIAVEPQMGVGFFFIPIYIPGWLFGIGYLAYSIYGMQKQLGNVGHDAHLGGAAVGLVFAILCNPNLLSENGMYIAFMVCPLIALAYFVWKRK